MNDVVWRWLPHKRHHMWKLVDLWEWTFMPYEHKPQSRRDKPIPCVDWNAPTPAPKPWLQPR